jgi:WD40 repeat protein
LVFSKDGGRLMTGSTDGAARVWEPLTGREVARLQARSPVLAIAMSPDGKYLATGSDDGVVRTWFLRPGDLIGEACSRVTRNLTREEWSQFLPDEPYAATCPNLPGDGTEIPAASPR